CAGADTARVDAGFTARTSCLGTANERVRPPVAAGSSPGPPLPREAHVRDPDSSRLQPGFPALPWSQQRKQRRCVVNRPFLMLRLTVKDGERAFLMRNGRFERVLGPGRHQMFDPMRGLTAELHQVVRAEFPAERHAVLKAARPDL